MPPAHPGPGPDPSPESPAEAADPPHLVFRGAVAGTIADCPILIVDATDLGRARIGAILAEAGFSNLTFAGGGAEALAMVAARPFDLAVVDVPMAEIDGLEVCRCLRNDPATADLPILVQASPRSTDERNRAFAAGATDLIATPVDPAELLARVRIQLENRVLIRDLSLYRDRVEGELDIARSMFEQLLPSDAALRTLHRDTGLVLLAHRVAADGLGGDLWGTIGLAGRRIGVFLLSIPGNGVTAAVNAFRLHTVIQEFGQMLGDDPEAFLSVLNDCACEFFEGGRLATILYGVVDANEGYFRYVAAGAANPLIVTPDGRSAMGEAGGVPLGVSASSRYESVRLLLPPGAVLVLYSVAVLSTLDAGGTGVGLGMMVARAVAEGGGEEGFDRVARALSRSLGSNPGDDRTLLWIERKAAE